MAERHCLRAFRLSFSGRPDVRQKRSVKAVFMCEVIPGGLFVGG